MQNKVIPYQEIRRIIKRCKRKRTQALLAFQYAMGNRAGELAKAYKHKEQKIIKDKKTKEKKLVAVGEYFSPGARRKRFYKTKDGIYWTSPNFKSKYEKTKKAFVLKEEKWLYKILKKWLTKRKGKKFLFNLKHSRIKGLIDKELKKYDKEYSTHWLRHSRATHIGEWTGDPFAVKAVLGHADIKTSARYVHYGEKALKKAFKKEKPF